MDDHCKNCRQGIHNCADIFCGCTCSQEEDIPLVKIMSHRIMNEVVRELVPNITPKAETQVREKVESIIDSTCAGADTIIR
jgi:hypothetical protein